MVTDVLLLWAVPVNKSFGCLSTLGLDQSDGVPISVIVSCVGDESICWKPCQHLIHVSQSKVPAHQRRLDQTSYSKPASASCH